MNTSKSKLKVHLSFCCPFAFHSTTNRYHSQVHRSDSSRWTSTPNSHYAGFIRKHSFVSDRSLQSKYLSQSRCAIPHLQYCFKCSWLDELSLFKEKYGSVTSILRVAELKHDISNLELIIKHLREGLEILNEEIEKTLAELKEIKKPSKRD